LGGGGWGRATVWARWCGSERRNVAASNRSWGLRLFLLESRPAACRKSGLPTVLRRRMTMPRLCCWRSALAMLAASFAMACPASAQFAPPPAQRGPQQAPATQGARPGYQAAGQAQPRAAQAQGTQGNPSRQQVPMPPRPQAPFQLSQAEFEQLWQVLKTWESHGDRVETKIG